MKVGIRELVAAAVLVVGGQRRLPAHAEVQRQARVDLEGVLRVGGEHRLAHVIGKRVAVHEGRHAADHQVRQRVAGGAAVERDLPVGLLVVGGVELLLAAVEAEGDLVPAVDQVKSSETWKVLMLK